MTFQVNRPIFAIEDLVGAKTWGRMIATAGEEMLFTYDLQEAFLAGRQANITGSQTVNAIGLFVGSTVPNTEAWYIYRLSAFSNTLVAGNTLGFSLYYTQFVSPPGAGAQQIHGAPGRVATVGERCINSMECNIWLPPGATFGVEAYAFAGAGIPIGISAHAARIAL